MGTGRDFMGLVNLQRGDEFFLGSNFYAIKKGKIISKNILKTGRIIIDENCMKRGEIIGNFFMLLKEENSFENEIESEVEIEVEALEDNTVLEEINLPLKKIYEDKYFRKILIQLHKKLMVKFFYQFYNAEGYILRILKLYLDDDGTIKKEEISYRNFNISKTQFYRIYSKLKEDKFISEKNDRIYINMRKTDKYLEQLSEK